MVDRNLAEEGMSDITISPNKTKEGAIHNDPWGDRGNQGPPDLDEAIKKLQGQLSGLFGGGRQAAAARRWVFRVLYAGFFGVFAPRSQLLMLHWVYTRLMSKNEY